MAASLCQLRSRTLALGPDCFVGGILAMPPLFLLYYRITTNLNGCAPFIVSV
jgi:hypothetical protein